MNTQTLMAKDFINTYLNGRYEEGKDESTDVIVNMISTLERERNEARREAEEFRDDMNIHLTEGDGKFTWENTAQTQPAQQGAHIMENTTIYTNKESAQKAIDRYEDAIYQLQEDLGLLENFVVHDETTYVVAKYYDKDGNVLKLQWG